MIHSMTIEELIDSLETIPFLFIGSGFSRRYFNLPDWRNLLIKMVEMFNKDSLAYRAYEDKVSFMDKVYGPNPAIASLIEKDFNKIWFKHNETRNVKNNLLEQVKDGCSPFKAEIAHYIKSNSILVSEFKDEVTLLKNISKKSIAGIITTNYDTFFEKYLSDFKTYVGQNELLFSQLQGIAEVYKIHGSVLDAQSIIINECDYREFKEKREYLAAKLLTIFMEYPIIFLGYSISDVNIREILSSIVKCMTTEKINRLKKKFIFIEYVEGFEGYEIGESTFSFDDGKMLSMIKVTLSDYSIIYNAIGRRRLKLPVRMLRILKDELYEYTLTNTPTKKMRVASIDDERVANEDLVLSIGTVSVLNINGLKGITTDQWYRNIVMDNLEYNNEDLMSVAIELSKQMSGILPVNSIVCSMNDASEYSGLIIQDFEQLISNTMKKERERNMKLKDIENILSMDLGLRKELLYIAYLREDQQDFEQLDIYLKSLFVHNMEILTESPPQIRTNIRRLIRIYDYLKGKLKNL